MSWNPLALPAQPGKVFVVTGGNAGIGYFISEQLADTGAKVIIAGRNQTKVDAAIRAIHSRVPRADLSSVPLDLADLSSVRAAAEKLGTYGRIDALITNAATMGGKTRNVTKDGFELSFGANYLGHFALAALVFEILAKTPASRIVTVGSFAYKWAKFDISDLQSEQQYGEFVAYANSKLANLLFAFELDRRLKAATSPVRSVAAHPGGGHDTLTRTVPGVHERTTADRFKAIPHSFFSTSKEKAAWPEVRAALDPKVTGGEYFGPKYTTRGPAVLVKVKPKALDTALARQLWTKSEELTEVPFTI
jgi:NAD(P)-dependent dehydrogenase (short-subunit alcohol dehydrogenase family)